MAKQAVVRKVTLNMNYKKQSPLNFSKIKLLATDQNIYDIALAIFSLQDASLNGIYKVIESEVCD